MGILTPARGRIAAPAFPGWLRLAGPAIAVSIGYVDPGNWASDIAAGAYGFRLLWTIIAANAMAIVLQLAVSRITTATGEDLAALIARRWPRCAPFGWVLFQGAVMATDVAEFTGIVLGAQLLFGIPTMWSVFFGLVVVATILGVNGRGLRLFYTAMVAAVAAIAAILLKLVGVVGPDAAAVARGALIPAIPDSAALLIVVSIVGATIMPHNLFLHSALVRRRLAESSPALRLQARRFFDWETIVALNLAAVVNAAILIVGASLSAHPTTIGEAFAALRPAAGVDAAALFGAALLISGIAASATATLSGDAICGALAPIRFPTPLRRAIAIGPAAVLLLLGANATALLLWSQVALCLVLPVAVVPVVVLLYRIERRYFFAAAVAASAICVALDVTLLWQSAG
jgi:manganese transport protein